MPAAVPKNWRRLMPCRLASRAPRSLMRASTSFCLLVWGSGMNSSLDTNWVGMGDRNAAVSAGRSWASSSGSSVGMVSSGTDRHERGRPLGP